MQRERADRSREGGKAPLVGGLRSSWRGIGPDKHRGCQAKLFSCVICLGKSFRGKLKKQFKNTFWSCVRSDPLYFIGPNSLSKNVGAMQDSNRLKYLHESEKDVFPPGLKKGVIFCWFWSPTRNMTQWVEWKKHSVEWREYDSCTYQWRKISRKPFHSRYATVRRVCW